MLTYLTLRSKLSAFADIYYLLFKSPQSPENLIWLISYPMSVPVAAHVSTITGVTLPGWFSYIIINYHYTSFHFQNTQFMSSKRDHFYLNCSFQLAVCQSYLWFFLNNTSLYKVCACPNNNFYYYEIFHLKKLLHCHI